MPTCKGCGAEIEWVPWSHQPVCLDPPAAKRFPWERATEVDWRGGFVVIRDFARAARRDDVTLHREIRRRHVCPPKSA